MGPVRQNPIQKTVRSVHVCALHCAQLLCTILHRTDLIIFPLTLQTIAIAPMMSIWGKAVHTEYGALRCVALRCGIRCRRTLSLGWPFLEHGAFLNTYISQGRIATRLTCGRILNNDFTTNLLLNLPVKSFENPLRCDGVIAVILVSSCFGTAYLRISVSIKRRW